MAREGKRARDEKRFGKPERFADWLMENTIEPWVRSAGQEDMTPKFRDVLARVPVVDLNNIVDFLGSCGIAQPHMTNGFPSCSTPFPLFFAEHVNKGFGGWTGFIVQQVDGPMEFDVHMFYKDDETRQANYPAVVSLKFNKESEPEEITISLNKDYSKTEGNGDTAISCMVPVLLAISFANCKNTTIEPHEPNAKLNRERTRHGLKPFLRYHTINIEPMRKVLKTEGGIETNGLKKALHICRGHFARYSEDKPLFGHTSGLVWRPAHTRGAIGQGVVVSDYKVNAPAAV